MIYYGVCVGPTTRFQELTLQSLNKLGVPAKALLTVRDAASIGAAYNHLIGQASVHSDLEGLVLLHDDVRIQDSNLEPRIRRLFRDPLVGVVGVIGARGLTGIRYRHARQLVGRVWDGGRYFDTGVWKGQVDAVDGLLMALSPTAVNSIRFDSDTFSDFHGYDVDFCLSCRTAGLRVLVEPFVLYHQSNGDDLGEASPHAERAFKEKWKDALVSPTVAARLIPERTRRQHLRRLVDELTSATSPTVAISQRTYKAVRRRMFSRRALNPPPSSGALAAVTEMPLGETQLPCCLLCGEVMAAVEGLPLARCGSCNLSRSWPAPDVDDSGSEIFKINYKDRVGMRAQWAYEAKQRLAWIESWVPEGIILEVGAATGEFVLEAAADGYESFGIEPSAWAADIARKSGADVMTGFLEDWLTEYAEFQVHAVALFHVVEHLQDPVDVLAQCRASMESDGKLFIEVPNAACSAAQERDPSWIGWSFGFHHWHYSPASLRATLERAGFSILEMRQMSARPYASGERWGWSRSRELAAGRIAPNLDFIRAVAAHAGRP